MWVVEGSAQSSTTIRASDDVQRRASFPKVIPEACGAMRALTRSSYGLAGAGAVRRLLPALGVACALAGCGRRVPVPPDFDVGAVPTATRDIAPPVDAGPPPPDAGGGWTPEALEEARALARRVAAETHPCFYGEVVIRGYPRVSALTYGGGAERKSLEGPAMWSSPGRRTSSRTIG